MELHQEKSTALKSTTIRTSTYSALYNENKVTVEVASTISVRQDLATGYVYSAQFSAGDLFSCFAYESILMENKGNQINTTMNQICRGSYNIDVLSTENKILGNTVKKQTDLSMRLSNSSGEYFFNLKGQVELTSDESAVLSGTVTLDENMFAPTGQYVFILEQKTAMAATMLQLNASAPLKATIIMPDGQVIDPYVFSWADLHPSGLFGLTGIAIAFTNQEDVPLAFFVSVFGLMASGILGGIFAVIDIILAVGEFYVNSYGLMCMYLETVMVMYPPYPITYAECGYYTDQCLGYPMGAFYFWPMSPFNNGPHQSIWPN